MIANHGDALARLLELRGRHRDDSGIISAVGLHVQDVVVAGIDQDIAVGQAVTVLFVLRCGQNDGVRGLVLGNEAAAFVTQRKFQRLSTVVVLSL